MCVVRDEIPYSFMNHFHFRLVCFKTFVDLPDTVRAQFCLSKFELELLVLLKPSQFKIYNLRVLQFLIWTRTLPTYSFCLIKIFERRYHLKILRSVRCCVQTK